MARWAEDAMLPTSKTAERPKSRAGNHLRWSSRHKDEEPRGTHRPQGSRLLALFFRRFLIDGSQLACWLFQFVDPILHPRLTFLLEVTPGC
jgi:hypothetical protein